MITAHFYNKTADGKQEEKPFFSIEASDDKTMTLQLEAKVRALMAENIAIGIHYDVVVAEIGSFNSVWQ